MTYEYPENFARIIAPFRVMMHVMDKDDQIINVHFHLEWEEENTWQQEEWDVPMRFFFRYELEHLVERSKFESYKILGDYLGNELSQDSKEYVVTCHKNKESVIT